MCKQKAYPIVLALLTFVLSLAIVVATQHYYVVPYNFSSLCYNYPKAKCSTLEELASTINETSFTDDNIVLIFLPGEHLLTRQITITGAPNVTISGQISANASSVIRCQETSAFGFENILNLNIAHIEFTGCKNNLTNGGVMFVRDVAHVFIAHCSFYRNLAVGYNGGSIYVENSVSLRIQTCHFNENSAICLHKDCTGGVISVYMTNETIIDQSIFDNNFAYCMHGVCEGGSVNIIAGTLFCTRSTFAYNVADHGGAIFISNGSLVSTKSNFASNGANGHGGAVLVADGSLSSTQCNFTSNEANNYGGGIFITDGSLSSVKSTFKTNKAVLGGAIIIVDGSFTSMESYFTSNEGKLNSSGGAIFISNGSFSSAESYFANNVASESGGAIHIENGSLSSRKSNFTSNSAVHGGAIFIIDGSFFSTKSNFTSNEAILGGALFLIDNNPRDSHPFWLFNFLSEVSFFGSNLAEYGGAVFVTGFKHAAMYINSTESFYKNNTAVYGGGAIYASYGAFVSNDTHYDGNVANTGGAVYLMDVVFYSNGSHFMNNIAKDEGGAFYILTSHRWTNQITGSVFSNNTAKNGAAFSWTNGGFEIGQSNFTNNFARDKGTVYVTDIKIVFLLNQSVSFQDNHGSLYASSSQIEIFGIADFINNVGGYGGAITGIESQFTFGNFSIVSIIGNTAIYGGGMYLAQCQLQVQNLIEIVRNKAHKSGGGIYAYSGEILFKLIQLGFHGLKNQTQNVSSNFAAIHGGAIYAIAAIIRIKQMFVSFSSNVAKGKGGALYLEEMSKIYVHKAVPEYLVSMDYRKLKVDRDVRLFFTDNSAEYGGAIYVSDDTNSGVLCRQANAEPGPIFSSTECFIQNPREYLHVFRPELRVNFISTIFMNNSASMSGRDLYGGILDRCTTNSLAETLSFYPEFNTSSGLDNLLLTVQLDQIVDHSRLIDPRNLTKAISRFDLKGSIASDAIQVAFCVNGTVDSTFNLPPISAKKGETIRVSVVAVDQVGNPVASKIIGKVISESRVGRFKAGQVEQLTGQQCTQLEYNVYSHDTTAQVQLHADGPCGDLGLSKKAFNILFVPCSCPIGLQPSPSDIDCICDCNQKLKHYKVTNCSQATGTIKIETNIWIGLAVTNTNDGMGFLIHDCPFDYCVDKPVNISLNSSYELNKQCAYDRVGVLCGECDEGLSLVFASSRCKECSHYFLLLILPFALAGIALVVLILLLNMTVATGTINGLIFYVNILAANRSIFLPFDSPNILTVFVSWLNLDLGIETCFYHGMNSYGKVLLQLVFPVYLFILIGIIIALCERSQKLSTLLGKKNPVATLCTLILLSYSKLIRTIIAALQFTILDYPDGSRDIVWLYDANVQYFSASHIPQFIAAFIIIILGGVYTTLLLFGQVFNLCSEFKFMKWVSHPKYDSFIKEYHAPLADKHRYWVGLLLLARIIHFLISAFATEPIVILSVCIITFGLVLLKLLNKTIYKNWLLDTLETFFLVNLMILALSTFYVKLVQGNQTALANTSMAISFIIFLGIVLYHSFAKFWAKAGVLVLYQRARDAINRRRPYEPAPDEDLDQEDLSDNDELHFEAETVLNDTESHSAAPPHYQTPPVIRRAERDDQLRELDLDILAPVNPQDYIVSAVPRPRRQQATTYSVVDIRSDKDKENITETEL